MFRPIDDEDTTTITTTTTPRDEITEIFDMLQDHLHLNREKGQRKLQHTLIMAKVKINKATANPSDSSAQEAAEESFQTVDKVKQNMYSLLDQQDSWEALQSGFNVSKVITPLIHDDDEYKSTMMSYVENYLEYDEVRVRNALTEALVELSQLMGVEILHKMKDRLYESIEKNFERVKTDQDDDPGMANFDGTFGEDHGASSGRVSPRGFLMTEKNTDLMHDTEGWKCLETSLKALQSILRGLDKLASDEIDVEMLDVVFAAIVHSNRFVREIGLFTTATICHICTVDKLLEEADSLIDLLSKGLSDNWSQVRFAASVAAREFLTNDAPDELKSKAFPVLLPRMCLNRYYVAEGVRVYSQDSWKRIVGMEGRNLIAQYIDETVAYYRISCSADNHAVREAACHCIAELATKIDREAVKPHVPDLLESLLFCFKDSSWPVRDAACTACGNFVAACPDQSKQMMEDELYQLFFDHLCDNIWSVRENSAMSLGKVIKAYGDEAFAVIEPVLIEMLPKVLEQPEDSHSHSSLENVTEFGVASAKQMRDNDIELHSNQAMFSCGSLAPKLKRGTGCMDHGFSRPKEPWEETDGAVYLLRELAIEYPDEMIPHMKELASMANLDVKFHHYPYLLETIWKQLPIICQNLGAQRTKSILGAFSQAHQRAVHCGHRLAEVAAEDAVAVIAQLTGMATKEVEQSLGLALRNVMDFDD
eukprot:TRINITY_DN1519_c1_g2_i1.p1 TRINITY_DN1519_c1_g2~~TRINITY_DN1519_c1_g2_i1.p1  ORF type:complete len:707 (+),score=256.45 TRINITY_DN1519_c1_g2_i1:1841-3961(+)